MTLDDFKVKLSTIWYEKLKEMYEYCYCDSDISAKMEKILNSKNYVIEDPNNEFKNIFNSFKTDSDIDIYLVESGESVSTFYAKNEFLDLMAQIGKDSQRGFKKFLEVFYFDNKGFKIAYKNCEAFRLVDSQMNPKTKKSFEKSRNGFLKKITKFDAAIKSFGLSMYPITMPVILGLNIAEKKAYKNMDEYTSSTEFEVVCRFLLKSKLME